MRTVKQIREELYWANDNGLTNDQIEALEAEMLEVEAFECGEIVESAVSIDIAEELSHVIPHKSRMSRKAELFTYWFKELNTENQRFFIQNKEELKKMYVRNNAETFRIGLPK